MKTHFWILLVCVSLLNCEQIDDEDLTEAIESTLPTHLVSNDSPLYELTPQMTFTENVYKFTPTNFSIEYFELEPEQNMKKNHRRCNLWLKYECEADKHLGVCLKVGKCENLVKPDHILTLKKGQFIKNNIFVVQPYHKDFCEEIKKLVGNRIDAVLKIPHKKYNGQFLTYYMDEDIIEKFPLNSMQFPFENINLAQLKTLVTGLDIEMDIKKKIQDTIKVLVSSKTNEKTLSLKDALDLFADQVTTATNEAVTQIGIFCKDVLIDPGTC